MFRARTRALQLYRSRVPSDGRCDVLPRGVSGISRRATRVTGSPWRDATARALSIFRKYQAPWWCLVLASLGAGRLVSAASAHPELKTAHGGEAVATVASQSGSATGLEPTTIIPNPPPSLGVIISETAASTAPPLKSTSLSETGAVDDATVPGDSAESRQALRARGRFGASARATVAGARPGTGPTSYVDPNRPELRVLMIGNSYTMHHTLHTLLQRVAASVAQGPQIIVDAEAHGGYSLRNHLRGRSALAKIRSGHYTHVVLQGHSLSALDRRSELEADAERFKQAIDAASGHTVFYATWARSPEARIYLRHPVVHSFEEMTQLVSSTYSDLSKRLGAELAPVGRAFERSLIRYPKLALWAADGSHPTLAGSYLAACVLYAAISGTDPRAAEYVPPGMEAAEAAQIREIAADSFARLKTVAPRPVNLATAPL